MPNAGWLKVGLWLKDKSNPNNWFRLNKVIPDFVELRGPHPYPDLHLAKIEYLHAYYVAPTYFECDDCRKKPGAPTLCADCYQRRKEFYERGESYCRLPRFCSNPFLAYNACGLPMDGPKYVPPAVRLPRYQRKWII